MRTLLWTILTVATVSLSVPACVVREQVVARPGTCRNGVWVEGHRGPHGRWHPAHWRCAGVVERIEID